MKRYVSLIAILITACISSNPKIPAVPADTVVKENQIYVNNNLYAELIIIGSGRSNNSCRGIAIHYLPSNKYEWISPEQGFKLGKDNEIISDIPELAKIWVTEPDPYYKIYKGSIRIGGDSYYKIEGRSIPTISRDALFVHYLEGGFFGPKERIYKIKY